MQADLSSRVCKFKSAVCAALRQKLAGHELVYKEIILKKYMPILFYGLGTFDINSYSLNTLSQVRNMVFRFVFDLNKHDSTWHAFQCCNTISIKFCLMKDYLYFLKISLIVKKTYCIICGVIYLNRSATANCSNSIICVVLKVNVVQDCALKLHLVIIVTFCGI